MAAPEILSTAFDPADYGPAVAALLLPERLAPLGPGTPNRARRDQLAALTPEVVLAGKPVRDRGMADACLAALWLYHDFLDDSHSVSQGLHTTTGSYWHAIMHRREPDYGNSGYWFRRVGQHSVFAGLAGEAARLAGDAGQPGFIAAEWDPFRFNDACQRALDSGSAEELLCRRIAQREWELLFDWCYQQAVGG